MTTTDDLSAATARLNAIADDLSHGEFKRGRLWGGADVVVTRSQPGSPSGEGFYPEPRYVVTKHAAEVSWLFGELWSAFRPMLDGASKIEFFGRLANAANRSIARTGADGDVRELLEAVLHEGFAMLDQLADGSFRYLLIASGNTIYDDLIEEAEREGYMSPDETHQWFVERGLE